MASRRERQVARERYERQLARRTADGSSAHARRRRPQQSIAAGLAVLAVFGGVFGLTRLGGGTPSAPPPAAAASASPDVSAGPSGAPSTGGSATAASGGCTYTRAAGEMPAKDVGLPSYDARRAAAPATVTLQTGQGLIAIELLTDRAPCTSYSFRHLTERSYFDGTSCHRLTTGGIFVLQCGDPTGSGSGGPGYGFGIENAPPDGRYPAGTVAMARTSDPNSNGSQFFLVYQDSALPTSGGGYSVFGRVTRGVDVLAKVAAAGSDPPQDGAPKTPVMISSARVAEGAR